MKRDFKGQGGAVCVWGGVRICSGVRNPGFKFHSAFGIVCGLGQDLFQNLSANFAGKVIYLAFKEDKIKQNF